MDQKLLEAYRKQRAEYPFTNSATSALKHARIMLDRPAPVLWLEGNGKAFGSEILYTTRFDEDDFRVEVEVISDDDQRNDMFGEVTDAQSHARSCDSCETIEVGRARFYTCSRPSRQAILVTYTDMHNGAACAVWFEPENSAADSRKWYLENKFPKWYAYERSQAEAREDAKRLAGFYGYQWQYVGVRARAFLADKMVGEAAVWGVDFDGSDFTYLDDVAREEVQSAVSAAIDSIPARIKEARDDAAILEMWYDRLRESRPELPDWRAALAQAERAERERVSQHNAA